MFFCWNWCLYLHVDKRQMHKSRDQTTLFIFVCSLFGLSALFFVSNTRSWSNFHKIACELQASYKLFGLKIDWNNGRRHKWHTAKGKANKTQSKSENEINFRKNEKLFVCLFFSQAVKVFTVLKTLYPAVEINLFLFNFLYPFRLRANKQTVFQANLMREMTIFLFQWNMINWKKHEKNNQFVCISVIN